MSRLTKEEAFQVLELDNSSSSSDIRNAYLRLARKHHPDRNSIPDAEELFKNISNAYQRLTDAAAISDDESDDETGDTDFYSFYSYMSKQNDDQSKSTSNPFEEYYEDDEDEDDEDVGDDDEFGASFFKFYSSKPDYTSFGTCGSDEYIPSRRTPRRTKENHQHWQEVRRQQKELERQQRLRRQVRKAERIKKLSARYKETFGTRFNGLNDHGNESFSFGNGIQQMDKKLDEK